MGETAGMIFVSGNTAIIVVMSVGKAPEHHFRKYMVTDAEVRVVFSLAQAGAFLEEQRARLGSYYNQLMQKVCAMNWARDGKIPPATRITGEAGDEIATQLLQLSVTNPTVLKAVKVDANEFIIDHDIVPKKSGGETIH